MNNVVPYLRAWSSCWAATSGQGRVAWVCTVSKTHFVVAFTSKGVGKATLKRYERLGGNLRGQTQMMNDNDGSFYHRIPGSVMAVLSNRPLFSLEPSWSFSPPRSRVR